MSTPEFTTDRRPADTSAGGSRPSQTKCQEGIEGAETPNSDIAPSDCVGATGLRPLSVDGASLRPEAAFVETPEGYRVPADGPGELPEGEVHARPWYRVVAEWRDWYESYESKHITFERGDGKTVRTRLENSYQPEYGNRYYAKLKDLERMVNQEFEGLTTAMLTFSASTLNAEGNPRCPADHMREVADGWDHARKRLYQALQGFNWEYCRIWEPTTETGKGPAGYGHMHVAVFIEDRDDLGSPTASTFAPVMDAYTDATPSAHPAAHRPDGSAVSVRSGGEFENLASYISEYIGAYGERAVDRPMHEQQFLAATWATGTRRVSFSQGANEMIREAQRRRETGTRPADRGGGESDESGAESDESGAESDVSGSGEEYDPDREWEVSCICSVVAKKPHRTDPTTGGVGRVETERRSGVDPPREV